MPVVTRSKKIFGCVKDANHKRVNDVTHVTRKRVKVSVSQPLFGENAFDRARILIENNMELSQTIEGSTNKYYTEEEKKNLSNQLFEKFCEIGFSAVSEDIEEKCADILENLNEKLTPPIIEKCADVFTFSSFCSVLN